MVKNKILVLLVLLVFFAIVGVAAFYSMSQKRSSDTLLLLKSDNAIDENLLKGWENIALEDGLHLDIKSDNDYLYSKELRPLDYKGIILPDIIHSRVSHVLVEKLKSYVESGGYLMLVYDAGTQDFNANPFKEGSLFSEMLNLKYGIDVKDNEETENSTTEQQDQFPGTESTGVGQQKHILLELGIPPGKCMSEKDAINIPAGTNPFCGISTYGYGILKYPHFITQPMKEDVPLLLTTVDRQFIAGVVNVGKGKILFVNLPLTNLWAETDSMLAHVFLKYFAVNMLKLPYLAPVPNGVGGIVMNLHTESQFDFDEFQILEDAGLFKQGPYSIDITAGPSVNFIPDSKPENKGTDILNNPKAQQWMHYFAALGNAIGSDGGWFHNYFGLNISEYNQAEFQKYITINVNAIEKIMNQKVLEYMPSEGNQPNWATRYLEQQGFLGYYTLSNAGAGPTRNFRNGVFDNPNLWSFPALPFGTNASIRDFGFANLPVDNVSEWLVACTQFVALNHQARLMYFHPSDFKFFPQYLESLKAWLAEAKTLSTIGVFRWYSMVHLAKFLNKRRKVSWEIERNENYQTIKATHPENLEGQAWLIRKDACKKPAVTVGKGFIGENEQYWVVSSGKSRNLEFQCAPF